MTILICPGFHESELTQSFLEAFSESKDNWLIFPVFQSPPYSPRAILEFWQESFLEKNQSLVIIAFSAGVVGAWGAALALSRRYQVNIEAFIAVDGWGVPLWGDLPIYRVSHDYFTHWSSALLGGGEESFYADPPVEHLELWRSPQTIQGWRIKSNGSKIPLTAAEFISNFTKKMGLKPRPFRATLC